MEVEGKRLTVKIAPVVVAASLALAMGVLVAPGSALAQRAQGFHDSGPVAGGTTLGVSRSVAVPFPPQRFVPRQFIRPSFPFAVIAGAPAVVYAASPYDPAYYPPAYYDPAVGYSAPMSYSPPVSYTAPSGTVSFAADPTQNVVQFPTGRYELRGDGVSTPFTWAWIPNPPTSPPPVAPPALPAVPAASPTREPHSGGSQSPARVGHLYRWIDEQDVVHWTDRLDAVPERYRSRVKQPTPS